MSRRFLLALAALLFAGAAPSIAAAQASQAADNGSSGALSQRTSHDYPLDFYASNTCNGESVHVTATERSTTHLVMTPDGRAMFVWDIKYDHASATGVTTGLKYSFGGEQQQTTHEAAGTWSADVLVKEHLVSQGSAPNLVISWLRTYGYDGTKYFFDTKWIRIDCDGQ